ncbi:MAG: hypothetical protein AAF682_30390 [Planctomycetota bacterium]
MTRTWNLAPLLRGETRDLGDVHLTPGLRCGGRVVGPSGRGIPAATVALWRLSSPLELRASQANRIPWSRAIVRHTSPEGRFELSGLQRGVYRVAARAARWSETRRWLVVDGRTDELELRLDPGVAVEGVILGPGGQSVSAARVAVISEHDFAVEEDAWALLELCGTPVDVSGRFQLHEAATGAWILGGVPGGALVARPLEAGGDELTLALPEYVDDRDSASSTGALLPETADLLVRVLDSEGGAVPCGSVQLERRDAVLGWQPRTARLDPFGNVAFPGLPEGTYRARYRADADLPAGLRAVSVFAGRDASEIEVSLQRGHSTRAQLVLGSEPVVRVEVKRNGDPAPASTVGAAPRAEPGQLIWRLADSAATSATDGRGRVTIVLPRAGEYWFFARSGVHAPPSVKAVWCDSGVSRVTLEIGSGELSGLAASTAGEALAGAEVRLLPLDFAQGTAGALTSSTGDRLLLGETRARTEPDGRFLFRDVPLGDYALELSRPGYANRRLDDVSVGPLPVRLGGIELAPLCSLSVELHEAGCTNAGRGHSIVELSASDGTHAQLERVDERGRAEFDGLPSGTYVLRAPCAERLHQIGPIELTPNESNVRPFELR